MKNTGPKTVLTHEVDAEHTLISYSNFYPSLNTLESPQNALHYGPNDCGPLLAGLSHPKKN